MKPEEYDVLKAKFLKVYANVPMPLREEIIAVVDNEPFTWASARAEIMHDTEKAKKLIIQIRDIGVI